MYKLYNDEICMHISSMASVSDTHRSVSIEDNLCLKKDPCRRLHLSIIHMSGRLRPSV